MSSSVAQALADAFEHHRRGRLPEAEAGYRRVLEGAPNQPDALHRLGIIAHQVGRNDVALQLIDRAIAADPVHPAYYNDAGIVLHALGRVDEAIARYRKALALQPNYPKAHNGAGIAFKDQGRLDDAADSFRIALSLNPGYVDAQNNLGNVLRAQGRSAEAVRTFRKALQLGGHSPELWYNLGNALTDVAAFDDAAIAYARALVRKETPAAIAGFVGSLAAAELRHVDGDVRQMAIRALSTPWARPEELAPACMRLLAGTPGTGRVIGRASAAWPVRPKRDALFDETEAEAVFGDLLLRTLLESAPVCDLPTERFLTAARYALLDARTADDGATGDDELAFCCALARQCFINDYVFCWTETEIGHARALRDRIVASLRAGNVPAAFDVAIVAAYFPLLALTHAESLLTRPWPAPLAALLTQQLREPVQERIDRDAIARLTTIDDQVSLSVRQQYEEHPYPRWIGLPRPDVAASGSVDPGARFPRALRDRADALDILVAGCGTGQESIEFAQAFPRSRVLAVDLSLASLGYAERKARELRVGNVVHAQADIVKLGSLGRRFDVISSVGVLHHLADPLRGWRELVSILAPGGHMLVGLYSERSRRDVVAARTYIAAHGYRADGDDIRRCRQDLMSADLGGQFSRLALRRDFYVTGECRDLLFHVQEHRYALPEIGQHLETLGLRFDGFLLNPATASRYATRYPADPGMEDLGNWDTLEAEYPDAFAGMYIFWVCKP